MGKKIKKTVENFTCLVCKQNVVGDGFTDHCQSCLWSKHIDINPGDRLAKCCGLMEPVSSTKLKEGWRIFYRCQDCGYTRFNKVSPKDNMNAVIKLSARPIPLFGKLIVIAGATASGKDTVIAELLKINPTWKKIVTTTTRSPRAGEKDKVDHYFINRTQFENDVKLGKFLETNFYGGNWYGTYKKDFNKILSGKNIIWRVDATCATRVTSLFQESFASKVAKALLAQTKVIYIQLPDQETSRKRLQARGMSEEDIQRRLAQDQKNWQEGHFEHVIINYNGRLNEAVESIIKLTKT